MLPLRWKSIILSRVFSRKDERLIGLKSLGFVQEIFPAFGMKMTRDTHQAFGMYPSLRHALKISRSQGTAH